MPRPKPLASIDAAPATVIAVVLRVGPVCARYGARANASYASRALVIADDTMPRGAALEVAGDAAIAMTASIAPGDVVCAHGARRARRARRALDAFYSPCAFALARDGVVRVALRVDALAHQNWAPRRATAPDDDNDGDGALARVARRVASQPWRAMFARQRGTGDAAATQARCDAVVAFVRARQWALVRRSADALDAARRRSGRFCGGASTTTTYVECERVRELGGGVGGVGRVMVHIVGRVTYARFEDETGATLDGDVAMTRPVVWLAQSASSGVVVEVRLPPTPRDGVASDARFRNLEGAVIDVRYARVRPRGRDVGCDLVCGVESTWRRLDAKLDARCVELDARCPPVAARNRALTFDALASAMTSTGFVESSAVLTFEACVTSITVMNGDEKFIKVPSAKTRAFVPSASDLTYVGCRECSRELAPDANGVYRTCRSCSKNGGADVDDDDDVPMAYMWRDASLHLRGVEASGETLRARARGRVVSKLLGGIDAARVNDDNGDDDDDSDDEDSDNGGADYRRMSLALFSALATGTRNSPMTFVVKFPALDANGMPRSNELDVVDFSVN